MGTGILFFRNSFRQFPEMLTQNYLLIANSADPLHSHHSKQLLGHTRALGSEAWPLSFISSILCLQELPAVAYFILFEKPTSNHETNNRHFPSDACHFIVRTENLTHLSLIWTSASHLGISPGFYRYRDGVQLGLGLPTTLHAHSGSQPGPHSA